MLYTEREKDEWQWREKLIASASDGERAREKARGRRGGSDESHACDFGRSGDGKKRRSRRAADTHKINTLFTRTVRRRPRAPHPRGVRLATATATTTATAATATTTTTPTTTMVAAERWYHVRESPVRVGVCALSE